MIVDSIVEKPRKRQKANGCSVDHIKEQRISVLSAVGACNGTQRHINVIVAICQHLMLRLVNVLVDLGVHW